MLFKLEFRAFGVMLALCCTFSVSYSDVSEFNLEFSTLTSASKVSLLKVGPGSANQATFGSCSIRIQDPQLGIDAVYHYGVNAPSAMKLYFGSIKENRYGILLRSTSSDFWEMHTQANRTIEEFILKLDPIEKQTVFERLHKDFFGQNRRYNYRPFQSNCSTQLLALLMSITKEPIRFEEPLDSVTDETYFDIIQPYFESRSWNGLVINLTLGTDAHQPITCRETAFLPDRLESIIFESSLVGDDQSLISIDRAHDPLEKKNPAQSKIRFEPFHLFFVGLLLTIYITAQEVRSNVRNATFDLILFGLFLSASLGLIFVSANIMHAYSSFNYNLTWILPLHILPLLKFVPEYARRVYFGIWTGLFFAVFFAYWIYLYPMFRQLWPLILVLAIRSHRIANV